jgi:hypothetical protein
MCCTKNVRYVGKIWPALSSIDHGTGYQKCELEVILNSVKECDACGVVDSGKELATLNVGCAEPSFPGWVLFGEASGRPGWYGLYGLYGWSFFCSKRRRPNFEEV